MVDLEMQVEEGRVQLKKRLQLERRLRELEGKVSLLGHPCDEISFKNARGYASRVRASDLEVAIIIMRGLGCLKRGDA